MDIEELKSKTKKDLLNLARKANISVKSSTTKAELLDRLTEVYKEKIAAKLEKKIRKPVTVVKELAGKQPVADKEAPEREIETPIPEKIQERVVPKEKGQVIRESSVTFNIERPTHFGQSLFLVGNIPELGDWNPERALPCISPHYPNWSTTVNVSPRTTIEFKFIIKNPDGSIIWEREAKENRTFTVPNKEKRNLTFFWEP